MLQQRAAESPHDRAFTYLWDGEADELVLTFGDLDRRARGLARELEETVGAGERAVLLYPPGLDFAIALFACLYARVVPVPSYPPDPTRLDRTLPRLQEILEDADAKAILTTSGILMAQETLIEVAPALESYRWIATDEERPDEPFTAREVRESDIILLQYTSGSTGAPKGVVVTWENMRANTESLARAYRLSRESVVVSWLPHYHDMGFIVLVLTVTCGFHATLFSPLDFLQKPVRWLNAITKAKATTTLAPNFAFDLCVRKTTPADRAALDLSRMVTWLNAAEPIAAATIERFTKAFEPCGFELTALAPTYGLAEATVFVSCSPFGSPPVLHSSTSPEGKPVTRVSSGRVVDLDVVIVDPETRARVEDGQFGEIWLRGKAVGRGYWRKEEESEATFRATLASGEGPFLRTGDLGFLSKGELFVTGRHKDLIIVRGRNFYPSDIERTIEATTTAVRPGCGAVFSVTTEDGESAVVVYELDPRADENPDPIMTLIRHEVASTHDLPIDVVVLIKARSVPKTSSGKIMRRATREAFEQGTLEVVAQWRKPEPGPRAVIPDDGSLRGWVRQWCVDNLNVREVDMFQPLNTYGLTSVTGVALCSALSAKIGRRVQAPLLFKYPSIDALCAYLEANTPKGQQGGAR
jgi:acyl-CoA synthetase (AMP-forming)/AMP-acid ligase II